MAAKKPVILSGPEGYLGIFDENKLEASVATNFCCRNHKEVVPDVLTKDILNLCSFDQNKLKILGKMCYNIVKLRYSARKMADDAIFVYNSLDSDFDPDPKKRLDTDAISTSVGATSIEKLEISNKDSKKHRAKSRKIDVVISGYYGYGNSGDEAILNAIISDLREIKPDINIVVLSSHSHETKRRYNVSAVHRFGLLSILHSLRRTKLLISGGGGLIQDVTSERSLFYYLTIIKLAKMCGAKVMLYANGIGPIVHKQNRGVINYFLNSADIITTRESHSLSELRDMNVSVPKMIVTCDPVFSMNYGESKSAAKILDKLNFDSKYFVISVRSCKSLGKNFDDVVVEFCEYLNKKHGLKALVLPMQFKYDMQISEKILKKLGQNGKMFSGRCGLEEILTLIKNSEFVLGMRLHSLIYAILAEVPSIGIIYDPKVEAFMNMTGQKSYIAAEKVSLAVLKKFADRILGRRTEISKDLANVRSKLTEKSKLNSKLAVKLIENNA
jgi:polysaccharide pyruvyl transferase CsaB